MHATAHRSALRPQVGVEAGGKLQPTRDGGTSALPAGGLAPAGRGTLNDASAMHTRAGGFAEVATRVRSSIERVGEIVLVSGLLLAQVEQTFEQHLGLVRAEPEV
jgi:hypothetical protein